MVDSLVFFVLMHGNGLAENVFLLFIQRVYKLVHFAKAFCDDFVFFAHFFAAKICYTAQNYSFFYISAKLSTKKKVCT